MKIIEPKNIKTFKDYVKYINQHKNENKLRLYRGQKENFWNLESQLFYQLRVNKQEREFYNIEKRILENFKQELMKINPSNSEFSDWDILSIGRHYGLPTRLIDWSTNPLIALWFAFEEEKNNNDERIVWGLVVEEEYLADFEKDNPYNGRFIKVFRPNKLDIRIIAQESWFTVQNPTLFGKGGDGLPRFNEYNIINQLEEYDYLLARIKIPNAERINILGELDKVGINRNSIYPDLNKICENIKLNEFQ